MDDNGYPHVLKHVFHSRHLDKFMELMENCLDTDRYSDLLDWEEIATTLRLNDPAMHYSSYCLEKEYNRQYELYKLFLLLSTKHGLQYDRLTKHLTYSDEIYDEVSYYEPRIHDIKHEMLESSIFSRWAEVFAARSKLSAAAVYDETQIGGVNVMRWNPSISYPGASRSSSSSHKYRRLNSTGEADSSNNPAVLTARLKGLHVPIDAIYRAISKNNSLGMNHSTLLDQGDDHLLRWVATYVLESEDNLPVYLQNWKRDIMLNIESIPSTQEG